MEDKNNFIDDIINLQQENEIELNNVVGRIKDIEEIEYNIVKLTLIIMGNVYNGIYIKYFQENIDLQKDDIIKLFMIEIIKKERSLYIYATNYHKLKNIKNVDTVSINKIKVTYDLNPLALIKTINKITNANYKSDIFIIKEINKEYTLISLLENEEFSIKDDEYKTTFKEFILSNNLKNDSLILIDNYILNKSELLFNNTTLFNLVKLEYIDEYFKTKLNNDNNNKNVFYYKINGFTKRNFVFFKVIDIQDDYIVGIDYFMNIYKISNKYEKIKTIKNVYTIVFIKYFKESVEDSFYNLDLVENSFIYIFDNTFCDIFLNNLTVINFNFIDFLDSSEGNYFNQIGFVKDNFVFTISKRTEFIILFKKCILDNMFYPYGLHLINHNKEKHYFGFIMYLGLLNKINCFINNFDKETYGYEYFYYNFKYDLPIIQNVNIKNIKYNIENSDNFNSKARKRFIVLNYYDNENTKIYYKNKENYLIKLAKKKKDNQKTEIKNEKKEISENNIYDLQDFLKDNDEDDYTHEIIYHNSFLLIFFYENNNKKLLGFYNIDEINSLFPLEKDIYVPNIEFKIFYNFFKIMNDKKISNKKKLEYLNSLEKYKNNDEIKNIIINSNIDFSDIDYENYIICINLCLFYYSNKTELKSALINEFREKFNQLKNSKIPYYDRLRIMKFVCKEFCEISKENRKMHLLILDELVDENSYKIANNYNKNMISNLDEKSRLFIPFLQLDSYILYNFCMDADSYTLSLEPLILTKKHLLSSYDDFIFTCKQKATKTRKLYAFQTVKTDLTTINEYCLFFENNNCDSDVIMGNDYAVPISLELLHERNGHSKKNKKNRRNLTPLYFYKKNKMKKISKNSQDNNNSEEKGEAGLLVEYFIRYKKSQLIELLRTKLVLGNLINNVNLFLNENFEELSNEINNLIKIKKEDEKKQDKSLDDCLIMNSVQIKNAPVDKKINEKKDLSENSILYYEQKYLLDGKYFIYPNSIPFEYVDCNEKDRPIPDGKKDYLDKYHNEIIEGRKQHYKN